jgi:hypothetical protein
MTLDEIVNVWQCGCHASSQRRVPIRSLQRIYPNNPVSHARKPGHFACQTFRFSAIPTIGQDDDDCTASHPARTPVIVELLKTFT